MSTMSRVALAVVVVASVGIAPAARQQAPPPQAPSQPADQQPAPPTFRVEANFVRVDAFVTEDGQPVRDLGMADFEVLEDGVPQEVETFERVDVRTNIPQEERVEPQTAAEGRAMAKEPRSRVFVLFLDTDHASVDSSQRMRTAIPKLLNDIIGPDDLFAVMVPGMAPEDITFARRTLVIENILERYWAWGRRHRVTGRDEIEELYVSCYPTNSRCEEIGLEMIDRRREQRVLESLRALVGYLRTVREERKAIIAVSEGWRLYRPDRVLVEGVGCTRPSSTTLGTSPQGRLVPDADRAHGELPRGDCEQDRILLGQYDGDQEFRDLLDEANRSNASFYPVDPRGLPAFDRPLSDPRALRVVEDMALLRQRIESLQTLAGATDGLAIVNSNDIERGLHRIVDDLTSYYLLGYYSTNPKLDGGYRKITVRVKRPGVEVRARRGYRAATEAEVAARREAEVEAARVDPARMALDAAFSALGKSAGTPRMQSLSGWIPGETGLSAVWMVTELEAGFARRPEWQQGGTVELQLVTPGGDVASESKTELAPGGRLIEQQFTALELGPGEYVLRLRLRPTGGGLPYQEATRFSVPDDVATPGSPRFLRRGPLTAHAFQPTGDVRFRRTDTLRVEVPLAGDGETSVRAELLDRNGGIMTVPVTTAVRRDAKSGVTWGTADVSLGPLAAGDYAVRLVMERGQTRHERLIAFRVVP